MSIVSLAAITCYGAAVASQGSQLNGKTTLGKVGLFTFGGIAFVLHAILLYHLIDLQGGQNLYFFNLLSLVAWLTGGMVLVLALSKPVHNLCLIIYPVALLTIALSGLFPGSYMVQTASNWQGIAHILLAIFAISTFCLAVLQAILLAVQDGLIRSRHGGKLIHILPPIETMENVLFGTIAVGFVLLSILIFDAVMAFHGLSNYQLWQKTLMAVIAWMIFAILLWGRHFAGWRGRAAIYWTLAGFALLLIAYFGTKMLMV